MANGTRKEKVSFNIMCCCINVLPALLLICEIIVLFVIAGITYSDLLASPECDSAWWSLIAVPIVDIINLTMVFASCGIWTVAMVGYLTNCLMRIFPFYVVGMLIAPNDALMNKGQNASICLDDPYYPRVKGTVIYECVMLIVPLIFFLVNFCCRVK